MTFSLSLQNQTASQSKCDFYDKIIQLPASFRYIGFIFCDLKYVITNLLFSVQKPLLHLFFCLH